MLEMSGGSAGAVQGDVRAGLAKPGAMPDDGFPPFDAVRVRPASLEACRDAADQLDYLCGQVQGSYQRTRTAEGLVVVRVKTAGGDVLASTQATTGACVAHLLSRAGVTS